MNMESIIDMLQCIAILLLTINVSDINRRERKKKADEREATK